jgi:hypothetical protein
LHKAKTKKLTVAGQIGHCQGHWDKKWGLQDIVSGFKTEAARQYNMLTQGQGTAA